MNKKIIEAVLCIGLLALTAIPVIDAAPGPIKNAADSDLKVTIKRGISYGIKVDIENNGTTDFNNVNCAIKVTKRILSKRVLADEISNIGTLPAGNYTSVTAKLKLLSLGFIKVTVTVTADELTEPIVKTVKGFDILGFVRLRRLL